MPRRRRTRIRPAHVVAAFIALVLLLLAVTAYISLPRCPEGARSVISGPYCYVLYTEKKAWPEALLFCNERGGSLAVFSTLLQEQEVMTRLAPPGPVWVGATRVRSLGPWLDLRGEKLLYHNWAPSVRYDDVYVEPKRCLAVDGNNYWYALPCDAKIGFVCMFTKQ